MQALERPGRWGTAEWPGMCVHLGLVVRWPGDPPQMSRDWEVKRLKADHKRNNLCFFSTEAIRRHRSHVLPPAKALT